MQEQPSPGTPEHRRVVPVPGHPGIFKKGSRYQVRYRHRGRQRARSFRTLTEATRFKRQVDAGEARPTSRVPFKRYAEQWLETYTGRTARGVSDRTRESYADALRRIAIPYFGTVRMDEIDPPQLKAFTKELAARGYAPATVRRHYSAVRALLATAYEEGLIASNPAAGVRVVVPDNRTRGPRRLTLEETRALLAAVPAEHADLVYLIAATGLRIGEALALTWADLGRDADGRPVLHVRKSKTDAGLRTLALSPETARRLTRRRASLEVDGDAAPMFGTRFGTPFDSHNFRRRVFKPAAREAGVPCATPHMLRHGMASLMAERGHSPAQIAAQLGHADGGQLALRTYVHVEPVETGFVDEALGA